MTSIAIASPIAPLLLAGRFSVADKCKNCHRPIKLADEWKGFIHTEGDRLWCFKDEAFSDTRGALVAAPPPEGCHLIPVSEPPRCETCKGNGQRGDVWVACHHCGGHGMRDYGGYVGECGICDGSGQERARDSRGRFSRPPCPDCTDGYARGPVELVVECERRADYGGPYDKRFVKVVQEPMASASLEAVLPIVDHWSGGGYPYVVLEGHNVFVPSGEPGAAVDISHLLPLCDWPIGGWAVLLGDVKPV